MTGIVSAHEKDDSREKDIIGSNAIQCDISVGGIISDLVN